MKRTLAAVLVCLVLTMTLAVPPARAEDEVYFVAAGSSVLPLTGSTMPFWSGGYLYVCSSIFTGLAWEALNVGHIAANDKQPLILYSGGDKSLMFTPGESFAKDVSGTTYYPGAIRRGGQTFVPAALVAKYFGLEYSLISDVEHGYLVWLRKPGFGLSEREFANAAVYSMTQRYEEYEKNRDTGHQSTGSLADPNDPQGKRTVYLCMQADSETQTLLDTLERSGVQAAFFCDRAFLESRGDLLRRMVAGGHAVGLLADAGAEEPVEDQLSEGNDLLYRAVCTKTRLVMMENAEEEDTAAAEAAGYCCFAPDVDRSGYSLQGSSGSKALLQKIAARKESATSIWLGDAVSPAGLRTFLDDVEDEVRCLALTELA